MTGQLIKVGSSEVDAYIALSKRGALLIVQRYDIWAKRPVIGC